jgi:hypothetical protein
MSAALPEDVHLHASPYSTPAYNQTGFHPQAASEHHGATSATLYDNNEFQRSVLQGHSIRTDDAYTLANVDPRMLTLSPLSHDQTFNSIGTPQQYDVDQSQFAPLPNPADYGDIWQWDHHDDLNIHGVDYAAAGLEDDRRVSQTSAAHQVLPLHPYTSSTPCATQCSMSAVGPDHLFIPAVLCRQDNHREILAHNTVQLLHRMEALKESNREGSTRDNSWVMEPRLYHATMPSNEQPVVAPQPLSAFQARWHRERDDMGPVEGFRYTVRPDTPVSADQTMPGSCSG